MKIVVFTCSTGGGHNSCARYIASEFKKRGIICDVKDYMQLAGEKASKRAEKLYLGSTKGKGNIFKTVYKLGELYNKTGIKSPVYGFNKMVVKNLDIFLEENGYDLAIGTHVFPCMALTELKKKKNVKFINVATDYECIPFWNETNPDIFVIPSEKLSNRFIEKGINKDVLLPIGIPVASSFFEVKGDVQLPNDKDIILLTSGSMGFGEMEECVKKILDDKTIQEEMINNQKKYINRNSAKDLVDYVLNKWYTNR